MNPFTDYRITSQFGYRIHPVTKQPHFHTGIDLVKYHKAPITAFVGGVVQYAGEGATGSGFGGGFGIVVAIRDDQGSLHCYIHLDSVAVKIGQIVKQGDIIGYQGNTGKYTTGSHLHYEIRKKSSPNNGWTAEEEDRCYNPTEYLIDYFKRNDEYMLKVEDANKIIKFLSAAWGATEDKEAREEFNRLANELRKASGQKIQ